MKAKASLVNSLVSRLCRPGLAGFAGLTFCLPTLAPAQFNYAISTDLTVTITAYTGPDGVVTIPDTIQGLPVTAIGGWNSSAKTSVIIPDSVTNIGSYAFQDSGLTSVTLGARIVSINDYAFYRCGRLASCSLPETVSEMRFGAFSSCTSLTNVTIGNGLKAIPPHAFAECPSLVGVSFGSSVTNVDPSAFFLSRNLLTIDADPGNQTYSSLDGVLFNKSQSLLLQCPYGKKGSYVIPGSVTQVADAAFELCTSLSSITIFDSVKDIGRSAFAHCTSLGSIVVPPSNLGNGVFEYCFGLTNVTLASDTHTIAAAEFSMCTGLTAITIPDTVTNIGEQAFYSCDKLTNIVIPNGVTSIGNLAFATCSNLTGVYFQGDAPTMGGSAFSGADRSIIYYVPGTIGWSTPFAGRPALPIYTQIQTADGSFGVRSNQFGFSFTGTYGLSVVVEAAPSLTNPTWYPLQTNTLNGRPIYFSDPQWRDYTNRMYRVRWP